MKLKSVNRVIVPAEMPVKTFSENLKEVETKEAKETQPQTKEEPNAK